MRPEGMVMFVVVFAALMLAVNVVGRLVERVRLRRDRLELLVGYYAPLETRVLREMRGKLVAGFERNGGNEVFELRKEAIETVLRSREKRRLGRWWGDE